MLSCVSNKDHTCARSRDFIAYTARARTFFIDLREYFSDLGSGVGGTEKKSSENDQLTGHFQSFFFSELFFFFLISPENKTVKLVR